jgi:3-hydroxybutyryl-CoA dehydrogenase
LNIVSVGVVGCGIMGSGIAEVAARSGASVVVVEADSASVAAGRKRIEASLARAVRAHKLEEDSAAALAQAITVTTDFAVLADRQLVIEAVRESEQDKVAVFSALDSVVEAADAVLASNTSSIPIIRLASATSRPEFVVGIHFFNPVPVLPLVELVPSLLTGPAVLATARAFVEDQLKKTVVEARDRAGFVVNGLLIPYLLAAIRMYESGFATAEDIDAGMVKGCAHPLGPLALTDLIGLDTTRAVADSLYQEFKEPLFAPPPLLLRMVEAGLLGRKSGRGFFSYDS